MNSFWIFLLALFITTGTHAESILISTFAVKGVKPWDPDSIKQGITGSEEAVIYMSQKLASTRL